MRTVSLRLCSAKSYEQDARCLCIKLDAAAQFLCARLLALENLAHKILGLGNLAHKIPGLENLAHKISAPEKILCNSPLDNVLRKI